MRRDEGCWIARWPGLALVAVLFVAFASGALAENPSVGTNVVVGTITYLDEVSIEVAGTRARRSPDSLAMSDGRTVSWGSLHRGLDATMEIDTAGRLIEVDVGKVLE